MKYLVTDPCYLFDNSCEVWNPETGTLHSELSNALDETNFFEDFSGDYTVKEGKHAGVIIMEACGTANGDGTATLRGGVGNKNYEVGVDAGLVCIAKVPDDFDMTGELGALTTDIDEAWSWYREVSRI